MIVIYSSWTDMGVSLIILEWNDSDVYFCFDALYL